MKRIKMSYIDVFLPMGNNSKNFISLLLRKNNLAAKKSRDTRRVRENQLRLRVLFLENANKVLREQMERKDLETGELRYKDPKYALFSCEAVALYPKKSWAY